MHTFGPELRRLRQEAGLTQSELAARLGYAGGHTIISKLETGGRVPDADFALRAGRVLGGTEELVRCCTVDQAAALRQRADVLCAPSPSAEGRPPDPMDDLGCRGGTWSHRTEVGMDMDEPNRREFNALTFAAMFASAGEASRAMATADPLPLDLDDIEAEARDIRDVIHDLPHDALLTRAMEGWYNADQHLYRRLSTDTRNRLLFSTGMLACHCASLGRWLGKTTIARRMSTLAGQYARDSADPTLIGTVAGLRSRIAFDAQEYGKAADIAGAARAAAHRGQRARLAAYEAEALAAAGREREARAALDEMRAESSRGTRWTSGDVEIFSAVTVANLGEHDNAVRFARSYTTGNDNDLQGVGWAHATIGRCLIERDKPDPVAAAHAGILAVSETATMPDLGVLARTGALHTSLTRRWPALDEVGSLGDLLRGLEATLADHPRPSTTS